MAEPTLSIFGVNATQTATELVIQKADLPGLTATANNTAESLLVGVLLAAMPVLTQENFNLNTDQSIIVSNGFQSLITRGEDTYRQNNLTVALHKLEAVTGIDPDNY